jgi:hypothetical protein
MVRGGGIPEPEPEPISEAEWSGEEESVEAEPAPTRPGSISIDAVPEDSHSEPTFGDPEPTFSMESPILGQHSGSVAPPEHAPVEEDTAPVPGPLFGRRDPKEKAQRLARVLVSDIILYNPDRYRMALNTGRVREEFTDEIQKSWVEYVEQVGEEIATSTPFFDEALTEILEGGSGSS